MELLNISSNCRHAAAVLVNITRMIENMPRLKTIGFCQSRGIFNNADATQHFVSTLQRKKSSAQELPMIDPHELPEGNRDATYASIKRSLMRNQQLNRVDTLLLFPQPPQLPLPLLLLLLLLY
jgi:pyoverdine/dityrosine biosynthesis protein Dit1